MLLWEIKHKCYKRDKMVDRETRTNLREFRTSGRLSQVVVAQVGRCGDGGAIEGSRVVGAGGAMGRMSSVQVGGVV